MARRVPTIHTSSLAVVSFALALTLLGPASVSAKKAPYNGEYSMVTLALKGPETTDVYATFTTSDPDAYPIPAVLKKLQVKLKDQNDEVAFIKNAWEVEVDNQTATMFVDGPGFGEILYIQAHIKTDTREVVLKDQVPVLMRPDLVFEEVTAPTEVRVDELFNISAVVRELNGEVGATATISLLNGVTVLAAIPGVAVDPGDVAVTIIEGLTFSEAGTYDLTMTISDADPAEYDDANNDTTFSIEVVQPYQLSTYSFSHNNQDTYDRRQVSSWCSSTTTTERTRWTSNTSFTVTSYGRTPEGPIESFSWSLTTEAGLWGGKEINGLTPAYSDEYYASYSDYDAETGAWINMTVEPQTGRTSFQIYHNSNGEYYVYRVYSQIITEYTSNYSGTKHLAASQVVTIDVLLNDNAVIIGGSASLDLNRSYYSNNSNYSSGWFCRRYYSNYYRRTTYSGYGTGELDPSIFFKRILAPAQLTAESTLPDEIRLAGNYPNPFNPSTHLRFDLPEAAPVSLVIYDLAGGEVARLVEGFVEAGSHEIIWDGRMVSGAAAPTGVYLARMVTPGYTRTIKMVMMK